MFQWDANKRLLQIVERESKALRRKQRIQKKKYLKENMSSLEKKGRKDKNMIKGKRRNTNIGKK